MSTKRRKWSLEELHARFDENAPIDETPWPDPPPILELAGKEVPMNPLEMKYHNWANGVEAGPGRRFAAFQYSYRFVWKDGFEGFVDLGWRFPDRAAKLDWRPCMNWRLFRPVPDEGYDESYIGNDKEVRQERPPEAKKLIAMLDDNLSFAPCRRNRDHQYSISRGLAAALDGYLVMHMREVLA